MQQREYKNVIFTKHALQRIQKRRITQDAVVKTIERPDQKKLEDDGDTKYIRTMQDRQYHVVATYLKDERKWMVVSAWVRGEDDPKPFWMRILAWLFGGDKRKKK